MKSYISIVFLFFSYLFFGQDAHLDSEKDISFIKKSIDNYLKPYVEMNAWSGIVGVYKNGEPLLVKGYGYSNREHKIPNTKGTKFRIASISKLFTEVAILQLVESKSITLEDKLSKYIEDYPRGNEITIKHLLTHQSGIPHLNNFSNYDSLIKYDHRISEIIDMFKNMPLDFDPGQKRRYSNSGYVLLAFIIQKASGKSYEKYLHQELFIPNGLLATGIDHNSKILKNRASGYMFNEIVELVNADYVNMSIKIGGGSLYSNINDLNKFIQLLLKKEILKTTLKELPNFDKVNNQQVFTASGRVQGFCHQITHYLDSNLTVIILGNHYSNIALPISDDIFKMFNNLPYKVPINYFDKEIKLDTNSLKTFLGTYKFSFGPIGEIKMQNSGICYKVKGQQECDKLIPIGENIFFYPQTWVKIGFEQKVNNKYQVLNWIMGSNIYSANKILD